MEPAHQAIYKVLGGSDIIYDVISISDVWLTVMGVML